MAEYIKRQDDLNTGREKINEELTKSNNNAEKAKIDSSEALNIANQSIHQSQSVQDQLNQVIIGGDSSVEAAAARVDEENVTHTTLKERIDDGFTKTKTQLADTNSYTTDPSQTLSDGAKERRVVFTFIADDAPKADLDKLLPIMQDKNIPIGIGVITKYVGGERDSGPVMTWDDLKLMQKNGAEIMSHTHEHRNSTELTPEELDEDLRKSRQALIENGFIVDGLIYPYNANNSGTNKIAKKYFKYAYAKNGPRNQGQGANFPLFDNYSIARIAIGSYFDIPESGFPSDTTSLEYYKARVDWCIDNDSLGAFVLHSNPSEFNATQQQYVRDVIDYIRTKGYDIVSPREAFEIHGNIMQIGDHTTDDRFIIDAENKVYNRRMNIKTDAFNEHTVADDINDFEQEVTYTPISLAESQSGDYPIRRGGILTTFRLSSSSNNIVQYYDPINAPERVSFKRIVSGGTWQEWELVGSNYHLSENGKYNGNTPFDDFPIGVTVTSLSVTESSDGNVPKNRSGILTTFKSSRTYTSKQEYQIYPQNNSGKSESFIRYVNEDGSFTSWLNKNVLEFAMSKNFGSVGAHMTKDVVIDDLDGIMETDLVTVMTRVNTLPEGLIVNVHTVENGTVTLRLANMTGSSIDSGNCYYVVRALRQQ